MIAGQILRNYKKQRQMMPFLPPPGDFEEVITTNITTLQTEGSGWAFFQNNQLKGFLAGYKMDTLFGNTTCIPETHNEDGGRTPNFE